MLHLLQPTDPRWIEIVREDLSGLLADHAHCELKAAQSALAMVGRFGDEAPELIEPLSHLAREETAHFQQVCGHLAERSTPLGKPVKDDYVGALRRRAREDGNDAPLLLDRLLVSALIEARSCERFQCLAQGLADDALQQLYGGLMAAEARHFALFKGLAEQRYGATARRRLKTLATREAEICHTLPLGPTVHG